MNWNFQFKICCPNNRLVYHSLHQKTTANFCGMRQTVLNSRWSKMLFYEKWWHVVVTGGEDPTVTNRNKHLATVFKIQNVLENEKILMALLRTTLAANKAMISVLEFAKLSKLFEILFIFQKFWNKNLWSTPVLCCTQKTTPRSRVSLLVGNTFPAQNKTGADGTLYFFSFVKKYKL